nr:hypothetical protein [Tanacetum cinerariifolium]
MAGNTVKEMTINFRKPDKFEGHDFRRWQKKMHFLLTTLKVVYLLTTPMPELLEDATVEAIRIRAKWENDDYICRELWDSLESKYMAEDSSTKKFLDFKHTLKYGKDDLSLVQLGSHLRIEESLKVQDSDKGKGKEVGRHSVNMTEEGGKNKHHKQNKGITEVVKRITQMLVVRERGLRTNPKTKVDAIAWWIDSGATTHICKDRCWFKTYEPIEDGSVLYMGDDHFALVHGKGSVALEFSCGKTITLFNVLYVPKLCKNLVFGPMLNKCGYKQVYESDKYILSKCGVFVGFGYYNNGIFMLNLNKVPDDSDSIYMSSSTVVNSSLWHARLEHVHYKRMLEMSKDELIPAIDENTNKCTTCCRVIVRLPDPKRKTLGERGIDCIFVGYAEHSKAYRFYIIEPNDSVSINSIIESKDEIFDENRFYLIPRPKNIIPNSDKSQRDDHSGDVPSEISEPRKDPKTYNEAMQSQDAAFWKEAIDNEIRSIMENNTWVLSNLPPNCKSLGFRQKERIDYFDTYAPVTRITTIRLLLALAAIHNLVIHQMDVKTTLLNGNLDVEVYMKQPEGFVMPGNEHKVFDKTKKFFSSRFSLKDMGEADVILEKLKPNTGKPVDQLDYSRAIGFLMYAMTSTRPDIAYAVGRLSRFTCNPSRQRGYSDASWINHVEDSSFTSGWVFLLGGGTISRAFKKQTCITGSTMESEFVALVAAGREAEWLRNLIHEIPIWPKPIAPISIRCDSAPTMARAYSQILLGSQIHLIGRSWMIKEH